MSQFIEITHYEFNMFVKRAGYWIAYLLVGTFYLVSVLIPSGDPSGDRITSEMIWRQAGHLVFLFNIFMPLLAGILTADRMQRDFRFGLNELQRSTPLRLPVYILSKYLGSLAAVLLPIFFFSFASGICLIVMGNAPLEILWPLMLAFLSIAVPAHAFVVAFSLACPLIMPVRVYQVLFTGYWFWGNLLSPRAFPTISDTVLNAVGQYPLQAYFTVVIDSTHPVSQDYTPAQAVINLLVLAACITAALVATRLYLRRQEKRA